MILHGSAPLFTIDLPQKQQGPKETSGFFATIPMTRETLTAAEAGMTRSKIQAYRSAQDIRTVDSVIYHGEVSLWLRPMNRAKVPNDPSTAWHIEQY